MFQDEVLQRLGAAMEQGKARGYDEFIVLDGVPCFRQFALKLKPQGYLAYVFTVAQAQMEVIEDCDTAEQSVYAGFADAVAFLHANGADLSRFRAFKGNCPI